MGKHKHYDVIVAYYADTSQLVECRNPGRDNWFTVNGAPYFEESNEYRIKPEPVYPVTRMSDNEIEDAIRAGMEYQYVSTNVATTIANAAIRRAIQDGDVILPNID